MVWRMRVPGTCGNCDQSILWNLIFDMSSRRARELPKIEIGGTMFYLDLRLNEFREVENFANRIDLDELYETGEGHYKLGFDKKTKNLFEGTREEFNACKHAVEVTLPSQQKMDPLGFVWLMEDKGWLNAEDAKLKTAQLLNEYHIHKNGMVLQCKPKENGLLEKRKNTRTKQRGKKL